MYRRDSLHFPEDDVPTPRHPISYDGPINMYGEPDTTADVGSVGTMLYRSNPHYKQYTGQWTNGLFEGNGELIYRDGDVYTGTFLNGFPSGNGKLIYRDGDVYTGTFLNGFPSGNGKVIYIDGEHSSFTGQFLAGKLVDGELIYRDGDVYTGEFLNQLMHGKGKRVYIHNRDAQPHSRRTEIYEGEFRDGRRNGNGTSTYYNAFGDIMETKTGIFKDDRFVSHLGGAAAANRRRFKKSRASSHTKRKRSKRRRSIR
jgi:hypothetical protein